MPPVVLLAALLLTAAPASRRAVVGVAEPPTAPPDLAARTHELRMALRAQDRAVLELGELRARLVPGDGATGAPSLAQLDRDYEVAVAAYRIGDYRTAVRKLRRLLVQLEAVPESIEAHAQWLRAALRLAHAEVTMSNRAGYRAMLEQVAIIEPRHEPDPDEFSPTFRRDFDDAKRRVAGRPRRALSVRASGGGEVFVNGKPLGAAPATLHLPPGRYRIGGAAGAVRVPTTWIDLGRGDETVSLDFATAAALRVDSGPALVVATSEQASALATFGRWVGADRLVSARITSDRGAPILVGALHDARGAVLREGRIRAADRASAAPALAALAAFLLTGAPSALVDAGEPTAAAPGDSTRSSAPEGAEQLGSAVPAHPDLSVPEPSPPGPVASVPAASARPRWIKPAAIGSAGLAVGLGALAVQQALASRSSYDKANDLVRPDGVIADSERYRQLANAGDRGRRNAWIGAGGAVVFAATAGVLGYLSFTDAGPAIRF